MLLLADDARWPWLILVPLQEGATELHELLPTERAAFLERVTATGELLQRECRARSINVAMLGNRVPQLHCHIVARSPGDPNWPAPIWGFGSAEPYPEGDVPDFAARVAAALERRFPAP